MSFPLAYLITFGCYGARLHGHADGSVDRNTNRVGTPSLAANPRREELERLRMKGYTYELDEDRRNFVMDAIVDLCARRKWNLWAIHVRTKHVHFVVQAQIPPERIMRDAKAAASKRLNDSGLDKPGTRRWAHHGSTRYLWKRASVTAAVEYVLYQQGAPMAWWKNPSPDRREEP